VQIDDVVALITGGASGLGAGTARMIVERGGRAGILDLGSSGGAALARELGERALFVPVDVRDEDDVERAVARVAEHFGRIDVLVNAAGINTAARVLSRKGELHPLDLYRRTLEVNLIGAFDVLRRVTAVMARNAPGPDGERGVIVNVASMAALEGQAGQAAYSASKGGVVAMTLPLARDLAVHGIRVMTICPGVMDTGMLAGADERQRAELTAVHVFPKRLGTPADFARLVVEIVENGLLNGDVIRLDAGARL